MTNLRLTVEEDFFYEIEFCPFCGKQLVYAKADEIKHCVGTFHFMVIKGDRMDVE